MSVAATVLIGFAALLAIVAGSILLRRALTRTQLLLEELALAVAWVFLVASLVWLGAYLNGSALLGFREPWNWLAAAHFATAGFGALTITALCCRVVSNARALRTLRFLLVAHPLAYLVTAAGIMGWPYCDEIGATGYGAIFIVQLGAFVFGRPERMTTGPRCVVALAVAVPVVTMVFALAWAWGRPIFDLWEMVRYHGIVNAIGHVGLGFAGFAWGRPQAHAPLRPRTTQSRVMR